MATSGTVAFNLDLNSLVEEAFERCGQELRSGYDMRTARRSLNLLTIEWANRGINLWTIEQGVIPMVQAQICYALPTDTIDLMDMVIRTQTGIDQTDININRISSSTYSTIPNKNAQGRPIQVWIDRQSGDTNTTSITLNGAITSTATTITLSSVVGLNYVGFIKVDNETIGYNQISGNVLQNCVRGVDNSTAAQHSSGTAVSVRNLPNICVWPAPDQSNFYTFAYWRLRRIQDAGNGVNTEDIPFRMLPCMAAGLAYYLSLKIPGAETRIEMLKAFYEEQWALGSSEDREKASLRLAPRQYFY